MCSIVYLSLFRDAWHKIKPDVQKQNMYARAAKILPRKVSDWRIRTNSKQCQINTANRFTTTRMHEWCEKAPFNSNRRVVTLRCKGV